MAKFCPNCGSPLNGASKFCPSCGTPIAETTPPQAQSSPPASQPQIRPQQMPPQPSPMPQQPMPQQQMPPQAQMQGAPQQPAAQGPMPPQQGYPQQMQAPPMQRQMPQPQMMQGQQGQPMVQGQQGQPMIYPNAPGQNFGRQPYGAWPGQGMQNPYGQQGAVMYNVGPYEPDQGIVQMFLRYDNRLNRKPYILRGLAIFFVMFLLAVAVTILGGKKYGNMLAFAVALIFCIPSIMLMIRRLHDLDRPAWWVIGGFIPLINVALSFYLLLAAGTIGPNQYGPDPLEGQR